MKSFFAGMRWDFLLGSKVERVEIGINPKIQNHFENVGKIRETFGENLDKMGKNYEKYVGNYGKLWKI